MGKSTVKIAWITDIHLDFLKREERLSFYRTISVHRPDALLVGGDIATGNTLVAFLREMESRLSLPIYFVLGNHDFYGSSIPQVYEAAKSLSQGSDNLFWLPEAGIVKLTPSTCLVGHGSWADGRYGNYEGSTVMLNDYIHIKDFRNLSKDERLYKLHELGDGAARYLEEITRRAMKKFRKVILLTHVPPFEESCRHGGKPGHPHWLPHFSCKVVGDHLRAIMNDYRECHLTILCGHTHDRSTYNALPNLSVITGAAEYGKSEIQEIFNPDHGYKLARKNSSRDYANHNREEQ